MDVFRAFLSIPTQEGNTRAKQNTGTPNLRNVENPFKGYKPARDFPGGSAVKIPPSTVGGAIHPIPGRGRSCTLPCAAKSKTKYRQTQTRHPRPSGGQIARLGGRAVPPEATGGSMESRPSAGF